ncbi:MAG: hypothetical protein AAEJ53_14925, partial [Myxococcota bacterium]
MARDADSVPPEVALDHPYPGLVMAWVDRLESASLEDLQAGLEESLLPGLLAGSPIDQVLFFSPRDFPAPRPEVPLTPGAVEPNACVGERLLVLFFLDCPPQQAWAAHFESLGAVLAERGLGAWRWPRPSCPRCGARTATSTHCGSSSLRRQRSLVAGGGARPLLSGAGGRGRRGALLAHVCGSRASRGGRRRGTGGVRSRGGH